MANSNDEFQPQEHLEQRYGSSYLPLKWRLAWLRSEQPEAQILTRLVSHNDGIAIFQARIKLPQGAIATSWGARARSSDNDRQNEPDLSYILEAENQALERALTALGYGTEYASDFDAPFEHEGIALNVVAFPETSDAPTSLTSGPAPNNVTLAPPAPTPISRPQLTSVQAPPLDEPEDDEEIPDLDEDADDADADDERPNQTNIRPLPNRQPAASLGRTPTPLNRPVSPESNPTRRPSLSSTTPNVPPTNASVVGNPVVTERLKGIDDPALQIAIKQIYYEARRLHNLDEEIVDRRSINRFQAPVYELTLDQAEEYLEIIKNAPRRNQ